MSFLYFYYEKSSYSVHKHTLKVAQDIVQPLFAIFIKFQMLQKQRYDKVWIKIFTHYIFVYKHYCNFEYEAI
jgi:hypothetical protein